MTYDNLGRAAETKRYDTSAQGTLYEHSKGYYDEMGRVYRSELVNPGDTETADTDSYFSKGGKLKKLTDPYSESTTYVYDGAGRQTTVTDALGNETLTAYYADSKGKYVQQRNKIADQTYVTYSAGSWYDSDGRLKASAEYGTGSLPDPWPANPPASSDSVHVTSYEFDKLGRTTKVTDAAGIETTYAYDMFSRKTEEIQDAAQGGLAIKVTWQYDDWDGTESVYYDTIEAWEDAQNHQDTVYWYGAAKHPYAVTVTTYPDSGDVTVTYNDDGSGGGLGAFSGGDSGFGGRHERRPRRGAQRGARGPCRPRRNARQGVPTGRPCPAAAAPRASVSQRPLPVCLPLPLQSAFA